MGGSGITRDDWLSAIREATEPLPSADDDESVTIADFATLLGVQRCQAGKRMRMLVHAGKATLTRKSIRRVDGGVIWVPAYRLVK